jgi:hypothetical protein
MDFYVTLPSNVSSNKYFPDNTVANYVTKLPQRLSLEGKWGVGLVEMSYTLSWYNIDKPLEIGIIAGSTSFGGGAVPAGRYDSIRELVNVVNDEFLKYQNHVPKITVDTRTRQVSLHYGIENNKIVFPVINKDLCDILGLNAKKINENTKGLIKSYKQWEKMEGFKEHTAPNPDDMQIKGKSPYQLQSGYHSLYVYTDIVKPSIVGNSSVQLLRLVQVPSDGKFGDQVVITFPITYYTQLITNEIQNIEIHIKDETGKTLPFEFGRSILVLHFKKLP